MAKGRWMRKAAMAMMLSFAVAVAPLLTGCYGSFPMTKTVYKLNGASGSRLVNTLVYWLFLYIPVYGIAFLGDTLVVNLVEFWTGADIAGSGKAEMKGEDGTIYAFETSKDGRRATITVTRDGAVRGQLGFAKTSETTFDVSDAAGKVVARVVRTPDGGLRMTNPEGLLVTSIPASDLAATAR